MEAVNRITVKMTRRLSRTLSQSLSHSLSQRGHLESVGIMSTKAAPEPYIPSGVSSFGGSEKIVAPEPYLPGDVPNFSVMDSNYVPEKDKPPDQDQPQGLSGILEKFCNSTSMHGCGQISGAKYTTGRIIWALLTLGALGGLMVHLHSVFYSYYKWPIQTKVSLGFDNLAYPAITLCNLNRIKKNRLVRGYSKEMEDLKELVELIDPDALMQKIGNSGVGLQSVSSNDTTNSSTVATNTTSEEEGGPYSGMYSGIDLTTYDSDVYTAAVNETMDDDWEADHDPLHLIGQVFDTVYFNIDRKTRYKSGHKMKEMLISCTFDGKKCYAENFTLYQTTSHGNCWTLSSKRLVAKTTGVRAGLSLTLFLQTDEFISGLTNGYGIKMVVHDRGTKPLPQDEGILIAAATESNIGLVQKTIKRLGEPYGRCDDGLLFKENVGFQYSRQTCQVACDINAIYNECGCYGSEYEEIARKIDKKGVTCNSTSDKMCMNRVKWNLQQKNKVCKCDNPCNEVVYGMSVSSRQWPTDSFANLLLEGACEHDPSNCAKMRNKSNDSREIANNFVKLNIFYETLNYEMIEEEPLIDVFQFLASIGGALGLWIGLSLLSFLEIMQLIGDVLEYLVERCRHAGHYNNRVKT